MYYDYDGDDDDDDDDNNNNNQLRCLEVCNWVLKDIYPITNFYYLL
jgi:hypothetical protein